MTARTLKQMVVVITGASAGIGQALARELSKAGASLVLSARREDRLDSLNAELGGGHLCVRADVSNRDDCRQLIDRAFQWKGRIDTLVCNAGYGFYAPVSDGDPDEVRRMLATNLLGTVDCIQFALPFIRRQPLRDGWRGQVMIVSSAAGRRGIPFMGLYSATKAAQISVAEALRLEISPLAIAVTSIHPIQTSTDFGTVASEKGTIQLPPAPMAQTVEHVARRIVNGIKKPTAEIWPSRIAGLLFGFAGAAPRLYDLLLRKYRNDVVAANPSLRAGVEDH